MSKETKVITVMGREITYEIADVDINLLEFYTENPRIHYIISKYPPEEITQDLIYKELYKLAETKELIKDLEENKGLLDEVYVLGNKVVEGNRRLCAYRRLYKRKQTDTWRYIKTRKLQDDLTPEELFYILGIFHIKGKKEWDAYEKASYMHRMINVLGKNPKEIAQQLGHQPKTIVNKLKAYEMMTSKYLPQTNSNQSDEEAKDELRKFSYFEAFFAQKQLVKRYEETPSFMDDFVDWVKEGRLIKAQNVRILPDIIEKKKAFEVFRSEQPEDAFDAAWHNLHKHNPEKVDPFYKKMRDFVTMLKDAEVVKISKEINQDKKRRYELKNCLKSLKKFCKDVGIDV